MDRRSVLQSMFGVAGAVAVAGCFDPETDDGENPPEREGPHRVVRIDSEGVTRDSDALIVQEGNAFVVLALTNVGTWALTVDISLQLRDPGRSDLGSPYTRSVGPIEVGEQRRIRIDVEEAPERIGGYELVVTDA